MPCGGTKAQRPVIKSYMAVNFGERSKEVDCLLCKVIYAISPAGEENEKETKLFNVK